MFPAVHEHAAATRYFLQAAATTGTLLGLGEFGFLPRLPRVSAAEAKLDPKFVQFRPEMEPLVRLREDTPRERLLEEVAARSQRGTTYREMLTALQLARRGMGKKFALAGFAIILFSESMPKSQ